MSCATFATLLRLNPRNPNKQLIIAVSLRTSVPRNISCCGSGKTIWRGLGSRTGARLKTTLTMQIISNVQFDQPHSAAKPAKAKLSLVPAEKRLLNRELSLIEFFRQVLEEASNDRNPLLDRLRFLTIFSSIVDEFFMVRISGLKEEVEGGWVQPSPDGMTAAEQLAEIRKRLLPMIAEQMRCLTEEILPELENNGIVVAPYQSLTKAERDKADRYFLRQVFPVLTPLAVDPAHPFPYISGLSLNLGVMVQSGDADSS